MHHIPDLWYKPLLLAAGSQVQAALDDDKMKTTLIAGLFALVEVFILVQREHKRYPPCSYLLLLFCFSQLTNRIKLQNLSGLLGESCHEAASLIPLS